MKVFKKLLAAVLTAVFMMCLLCVGIYAEETEVGTETVVERNINIALHKNVVSSQGKTDSIKLTDGLYNADGFSGQAATDETFTVDLERLCRITDIKLWPAQKSGSISGDKMSDVAIEVSGNGDSWEIVAQQGDLPETITKENALETSLEGEKFYRYVRIRKTAQGDYEYGELEVFVDVLATELSRGKKVTATSESSAAPTAYTLESVVDGVTTAFGWIVENALHDEKCISIDLGKETPVDWIEMYTRRGIAAGAAYHRNWIAYGLSDGDEDSVLSPDGVGTKLFTSLATSAKEANFPVNVEANDPNNHLFETLDGKTPYRHLSFRKTDYHLGLAEIGAFIIKPEVAITEISGSDLTVLFTEKMNEETLEDIVLKVDGEELSYEIKSIEENEVILLLDSIYYGKRVDVFIPETLESARGVKIDPSVEICYFPQAVESSEPIFLNGTGDDAQEIESLDGNESAGVKMTFKNNQPEQTENVIMIAALYDENNTMIRIDEKKVTLEPSSEEVTLVAGFDLPTDTEGCRLSVFVWKNYRFMSPWFIHKSIS